MLHNQPSVMATTKKSHRSQWLEPQAPTIFLSHLFRKQKSIKQAKQPANITMKCNTLLLQCIMTTFVLLLARANNDNENVSSTQSWSIMFLASGGRASCSKIWLFACLLALLASRLPQMVKYADYVAWQVTRWVDFVTSIIMVKTNPLNIVILDRKNPQPQRLPRLPVSKLQSLPA